MIKPQKKTKFVKNRTIIFKKLVILFCIAITIFLVSPITPKFAIAATTTTTLGKGTLYKDIEGLSIMAINQELDGRAIIVNKSSKMYLKLIRQYTDMMLKYIKEAARYTKNSAKYTKNIAKALGYAKKIGDAYNDLALGRDRFAEQVFDHGWKNGIRDADRMLSHPGQSWIDVDWRRHYQKFGEVYAAVYDAGYAAGWKSKMK